MSFIVLIELITGSVCSVLFLLKEISYIQNYEVNHDDDYLKESHNYAFNESRPLSHSFIDGQAKK
jgi:hypothetical protein